MTNFNKVILMGRLTRDPELRYTPSNMPICKASLAVNRRYKDGQTGEWKEVPTFIDMTIFGKRGEVFERYHKKGQVAFVEGHLRLDSWEDKTTGQKRSKLDVVVDDWQFTGSGGPGGGASSGGGGYEGYEEGGSSSSYEPSQAGGYSAARPEPLEVDDTPF